MPFSKYSLSDERSNICSKKGILKDYNKAMFSAMWINNINLNEPKNIINVLESNNFDSKEFLEAAENNAIKKNLKPIPHKQFLKAYLVYPHL